HPGQATFFDTDIVATLNGTVVAQVCHSSRSWSNCGEVATIRPARNDGLLEHADEGGGELGAFSREDPKAGVRARREAALLAGVQVDVEPPARVADDVAERVGVEAALKPIAEAEVDGLRLATAAV